MKLVWLWVVERFVEEKEGLTLEEVAEGYLNELVRSMIQVVEMDHFDRVKSCRVHDIIREIIQSKSKEEALVEVLDDMHFSKTNNIKARPVTVNDNSEGLLETNKMVPHIWYVLLFTTIYKFFTRKEIISGIQTTEGGGARWCTYFRISRVLVDLIYLRHLSLRSTMIRKLAESIGNLKNLEVLDLERTLVSSLPVGILLLKQLRQLCIYHVGYGSSLYPDYRGVLVPVKLGCLTKLENLRNVQVHESYAIVREMCKLRELRRSGLVGLKGDVGSDLCKSAERLRSLIALHIFSHSFLLYFYSNHVIFNLPYPLLPMSIVHICKLITLSE